jgi:class 3 adenylate cyclase
MLSATIPNARFIPLEGKNHILLESDPSWPRFVTELYRFLGVDENKIAAFIESREHGALRDYQSVAILFADMASFTPLSTLLDPAELVKLLDTTFSQFDTILDNYGVQKLRIIGDEYMAAAGLARPQPDHAQKLAAAALDMLAYVNSLPKQKGQPISFRFGINVGPVTAGMVGRLDPHYGLWGDAVNIASRMESTGVPGKIQITRMAYEQLKDYFICESRGEIQVKGKGPMETWFLVGQRA